MKGIFKMRAPHSNLAGVLVTAGGSVGNRLGVIRAFGRRGVPVVYLDSEPSSTVRYSKYISTRLKCPSLRESEKKFVDALLAFGRKNYGRMMIIPTGDREVLAISKNQAELEQYYHLPVPAFETVQELVNKKNFYRLLVKMHFPHPETYFPESIEELRSMGKQLAYPCIIKPAYSLPFQEEFGRKCFVINSIQDLEQAMEKLRRKDVEVMIQEIIPGRETYMFYAYLNRKSEPLAICGYDKVRQYPLDYGSGSFCRSSWRPHLIEGCTKLLRAIGYCGFAEPELKKDPRDGQYKLLEINARTTLQNRLAASCGADVEYAAYLDAAGQCPRKAISSRNGVSWVDDFTDVLSCLTLARRKQISVADALSSWIAADAHSLACWDDPAPFIFDFAGLGLSSPAHLRTLLLARPIPTVKS